MSYFLSLLSLLFFFPRSLTTPQALAKNLRCKKSEKRIEKGSSITRGSEKVRDGNKKGKRREENSLRDERDSLVLEETEKVRGKI